MISSPLRARRLVGRAQECAFFEARATAAIRGQGAVAILLGGAGEGKTRLMRTWASNAEAHGFAVAAAQNYAFARTPYAPIVDILAPLLAREPRALPTLRKSERSSSGCSPLRFRSRTERSHSRGRNEDCSRSSDERSRALPPSARSPSLSMTPSGSTLSRSKCSSISQPRAKINASSWHSPRAPRRASDPPGSMSCC